MKTYIIRFFGKEPNPIELYPETEMLLLVERIVELTKRKALFSVYEVGACIGDFS